jgi:hypothetical protein
MKPKYVLWLALSLLALTLTACASGVSGGDLQAATQTELSHASQTLFPTETPQPSLTPTASLTPTHIRLLPPKRQLRLLRCTR